MKKSCYIFEYPNDDRMVGVNAHSLKKAKEMVSQIVGAKRSTLILYRIDPAFKSAFTRKERRLYK